MINVIPPNETGKHWEVWTDTEIQKRDGRCIGVGMTHEGALREARDEIRNELKTLDLSIEHLCHPEKL